MSDPVVTFVCWGNICRSPMASMVGRAWAARDGLTGVRFTDAGVSGEEEGRPIDPRAAAALRAAGYHVYDHRAHLITDDELREASMLIGMEKVHLARLKQRLAGVTGTVRVARPANSTSSANQAIGTVPTPTPQPDRCYLLSDFDPDAVPGSGIPDPWYGPDSRFGETLASIEAAMPEIMKRARELVG